MRVAFLTLYPYETASTRQRIYKNARLFPAEVEVVILPGISSDAVRRLDARGHGRVARLWFFLSEVGRKLLHLVHARRCDVIVVQKGLTVMNLRGLPSLLFSLGRPVVFDFDDAVHLGPPQLFRARLLRPWFDPEQVGRMMPRFARVIAGNPHLAEVAHARGAAVEVIVTPMDTNRYRCRPQPRRDRFVVGWSGATSTNRYVNLLGPTLVRAAERVPELEFVVISNDDRGIDWQRFAGVKTRFIPWRIESLVDDLLEIDVGVMPLDDDEWSRSKCGGKILQYMSCGIPPVASPVGINCGIIEDGRNGFLAAADDQWVERIVQLLRNPDLRATMGAAARQTVERAHANDITAPQLLRVLRDVVRESTPPDRRRELDPTPPGSRS